jgi:hypothetical protein
VSGLSSGGRGICRQEDRRGVGAALVSRSRCCDRYYCCLSAIVVVIVTVSQMARSCSQISKVRG